MFSIIPASISSLGLDAVDTVYALLLVAVVGIHILEEAAGDFPHFFNVQWFQGSEEFPVTKKKSLLVDQLGLLLILSLLAVAGSWEQTGALPILVTLGFITADLIQHTIFSVSKRGYTPGIASSSLYLAFVIYFMWHEFPGLLRTDSFGLLLGAMVVGAVILASNYIMAAWKVSRRPRREAALY